MRTYCLRCLIIFVFLSLYLIFPVFSIASSPESFGLTTQLTLPGDSKYPAKRLKEKVTEFFKFTQKSKSAYREVLLEKRLSELVILIENKNINDVANSTQRFAYQAGKLAEGSYNDNSERKNEIIALFEKYKPILDKMRDNFPSNSAFWLLSQQDIDTMNILTEKLK